MIVVVGYFELSVYGIQALALKLRYDSETRSKELSRHPRSQRLSYPNCSRTSKFRVPSGLANTFQYKKRSNSAEKIYNNIKKMFGSNDDVFCSNSGLLRRNSLEIT